MNNKILCRSAAAERFFQTCHHSTRLEKALPLAVHNMSSSVPNASAHEFIPVTINIPPPSAVSEDILRNPGLSLQPGDFLGVVLPEKHAELGEAKGLAETNVGDVKMTLDDLKSFVLRYYTRLYEPHERSVEERLNSIRQYHYPSSAPIGSWFPPLTANSEVRGSFSQELSGSSRPVPLTFLPPQVQASMASFRSTLPSAGAAARGSFALPLIPETPVMSQQTQKSFTPQSDLRCHVKNSPHETYTFSPDFDPANFRGLLTSATAAQHPTRLMPGGTRSKWNNGNVSTDLELDPAGAPPGVIEMLNAVRNEAHVATRRLAGLGDKLTLEGTDDPTLAAFGYVNCPPVKRRPRFGTQSEMEAHILQLYSDLHSQVQWNERKIQSLRHRLRILQMNTLAPLAQTRDDPRIGY